MITNGKIAAPRRIIVEGVHGIGKTTWAASAPKPVLIPTEEGANDVDVPKFPKASTFEEVMTHLHSIYEDKHSYQTLIIDSVDWLEKLIFDQVCEHHEKKVSSIEEIGYAKGYIFALQYWRRFMEALDAIRSERGMTIILIAHTQIVRFEDPETATYDRYAPALHKHAANLLTQWADEVLFACYKTIVRQSDEGFGKKKNRGIGTGERVLYTTERPGHVAKNRLGLPDELPMPKEDGWAVYAAYLNGNGNGNGKKNTKKEEVKADA